MVKYSDNVVTKFASYLDDESSIAEDTRASRIWFPTTHKEVIEVIQQANENSISVTISGGGTGISGGRAPTKGWILATDEMQYISDKDVQEWKDPDTGVTYGVKFFEEQGAHFVKVPVAMSLQSIQKCCRDQELMYPPDPTERSSYIGGNVSTNASGARSFKYGATRPWVEKLRVVLASGEDLILDRSSNPISNEGQLSFATDTKKYTIPLPDLDFPDVSKHVAGPVLTHRSEPIDLFIGTNGIFGVITEVTLKLLPAPSSIISMFAYCDRENQALNLVRQCQSHRSKDLYPIPMSVEYLDSNAIKIMQMKDKSIEPSAAVILLEQDVYSKEEEEKVLVAWQAVFDELGIDNISVALNHRENEHHKFLRHWVPEWLIKTTKSYGFPIFVSDTSVPEDKFEIFLDYLKEQRKRFEAVADADTLCTSMIGHVGDSHPHLCFIPTNSKQAELAQQIMTDLIEKTVELGGSMASEHGLGKKKFDDQPAIIKQYGNKGVEEVAKLKDILDPKYLLCPDNIIPAQN